MMQEIAPHIPALSVPVAAGLGALVAWLRLRKKDAAEADKASAEALQAQAEARLAAAEAAATDAEVGKRLREELRAEIAKLRDELDRQDQECRRRLLAMEEEQKVMRQGLEDARSIIARNGKVIAEQAEKIERLKAKVAELSGASEAQAPRARRQRAS